MEARTTDKVLEGMKVAILVADDFEQAEMTEPRQALDAAGARTTLISPKTGTVQGMKHDEKADRFQVDLALSDAKPAYFDALMLPGGALNADSLRVNEQARAFAREMDAADKPIAFICHAPCLLVSAGLVHGRTLTSYHTIQDDIRNAGARWVDRQVVRDRNWVSSRSPKDLQAFNPAMIELFREFGAASASVGGDRASARA